MSLARIHVHVHRLRRRYPTPSQSQLLPRLLCTHRRCLIHLAHLGPATVHHREPLLPAMTLRWPREPSRYDALLAHSLHNKAARPRPGLTRLTRSTPRLRLAPTVPLVLCHFALKNERWEGYWDLATLATKLDPLRTALFACNCPERENCSGCGDDGVTEHWQMSL